MSVEDKTADLEKSTVLEATVAVLDSSELTDVAQAQGEYTEEQFKKLRNKIDRYLMVIMFLTYGMQQADKTGLSTQATFGIRTDTHLVGQQYAWLSTGFYLAYMVCEFPASYMMQRVSVGHTLAVVMFLWGIVVLCIGFAKNFTGLIILRLIQGALECTISPSFLLIVGTWYSTKEHTSRAIYWGCANATIAGVIVPLIFFGIGKSAQAHGGWAAWRWMSVFLGATTIVLSFFSWFLLGTPREVVWLSEEEKRMASARVASNRTGTDRKKREWKMSQVKDAFMDPATWLLFFTVIANAMPNGGTTSFGNLVYVSFGFTALETLLYSIPQQVFSIIWFLLVAWVTTKWKNTRFLIMLFSIIPAFIGMLALGKLPHTESLLWTRWGMYFMTVTANVTGLMIWTFIPSNVAGRTKKTVVSSVLFVAYCTGNAVGAQLFQAKWAPQYTQALVACSICYAAQFGLMISWRFYYMYCNAQRDKRAVESGLTPEQIVTEGIVMAEADVTDRANPHFRYTY